jgi:hypothetical protein
MTWTKICQLYYATIFFKNRARCNGNTRSYLQKALCSNLCRVSDYCAWYLRSSQWLSSSGLWVWHHAVRKVVHSILKQNTAPFSGTFSKMFVPTYQITKQYDPKYQNMNILRDFLVSLQNPGACWDKRSQNWHIYYSHLFTIHSHSNV